MSDSSLLRPQLFDPAIGKAQRISPIGGAAVDQHTRVVGTNFGAAVDAQFWTLANNGAASAAAVANYICTLTSGTANNGYGSVVSSRRARFLFAHPNLLRVAARIPDTTEANCTRRWGAIDTTAGNPPTINNGFYFEVSDAGVLSVNHKVAGTAAVSVASGSFNGDVTSYTMDTNVHAYEIVYFVMGAWFYVDGVFLHKFTPTTAILNSTPDLPVFAEAVNSAGGTESGVLEVWAASILRIGKEASRPKYVHITTATTTVCKIGAGTLHRIVLNNPTNNAITVYDNTSAAVPAIAIIDPDASATPFEIVYDLDFQTGLTIVTAGTPDLTVVLD